MAPVFMPPCRDPAGPASHPLAAELDPNRPELFYLPEFFSSEPLLADIALPVGARLLPLHSQVLLV